MRDELTGFKAQTASKDLSKGLTRYLRQCYAQAV